MKTAREIHIKPFSYSDSTFRAHESPDHGPLADAEDDGEILLDVL